VSGIRALALPRFLAVSPGPRHRKQARREFDLGELRERRRFALPLLAGIGGMATAVAIYLAFNMGSSSAHGWGIAMSTDTAFALGLLALVGRRLPDRLRTFILTVVVVDDILALIVIATVYTEQVKVSALLAALSVFGVVLVVRALRVSQGLVYAVLGRRHGWRCSSRAWSRWSWASRWASWRTPTRRPGPISSALAIAFGSSASNRRQNWSAPRARS